MLQLKTPFNGIRGMPAIQAASAPQDIKDIIAYLRTTYPSQHQGGGDLGGGNPDTLATSRLMERNSRTIIATVVMSMEMEM